MFYSEKLTSFVIFHNQIFIRNCFRAINIKMNTSTRQIKNTKKFEKELKLIEEFNTLDNHEINLVGHEEVETRISKREKRINLEIKARIADDTETENFVFILGKNSYETKKLGNNSSHSEIKVNKSANFSTTLEINSFYSLDFNQNGIFKALYPINIKEIKTFHTEFETITHQRNGTEYFYDCIRININGTPYDLTQLKYNKSGFYIIECLAEQTFEEFTEATFSIRQAVGFINRLMVGDEEYIFDNLGKLYYSNYIRPTIKGMYSPITTNPYSYPDIEKEIADKFYGKLTRITLKSLSNLANKIHSDPEFSTAILVILEATSIRSLLLIPSSFAVIIELLSKNINKEEITSEIPIEDKKLKKKVIEEFHEVIDKNSHTLNEKSILKLKRRLNEINKPVHKQRLTNNEKLTRPFEQLGLKLSLQDITIIEHRNELLHGNILLKKDDDQNDDDINRYMGYVSAKLFTLISKLILKSIGYNGYVYNQAKYLEKQMKIETNEQYFERI